MKKIASVTVLAVVFAMILSMFTSCSIFNYSSSLNSGTQDGEDYMTEDEVRQMLGEINQEVHVEGGDNYNITIEGGNSDLASAGKALLSVVSITSNFTVTISYSTSLFGPPQTMQKKQTLYGSGVIYQLDKNKGDAYIITNYHVVFCEGADTADDISDDITLYLFGQEYDKYGIRASYVGGSKNYDIAVLKVSGSNVLRESNAIAADFADSNDICVLDTAIAIGNAEAAGISATVGAVNVDSEHITLTGIGGTGTSATLRVLRIDAAVNGGNSGGGLFNDKGELIGIVNAKLSDSSIDNIGYAIPSNVAKYVADNIIYYDSKDSKNDSVYRILIGVTVDVESAYSVYDTETGKIYKRESVVIETVNPGSASEGKLKVGDVVKTITVDGVDYEIVRSFNLIDVMLTARNSSNIVFHIVRDGAEMDVSMDLSSLTLTEY